MGYNTDFEIVVTLRELPKGIKNASVDLTEVMNELIKIEPNENFSIRNNNTIVTGEECRWYDSEKHLKEISEMFSGILLTVTATGEEPGDISRCYYYKGYAQPSTMVFSPFVPFD